MDAFLHTHPTVAMITNIEMDHPDYFKSIDTLKESFLRFINSSTELAVVNLDDKHTASIIGKIRSRTVTYGAFDGADYTFRIVGFDNSQYRFSVSTSQGKLGDFSLKLPGVFNISNATCAIATACELGVSIPVIKDAISSFQGIKRRLEYLGSLHGFPVLYDYAHHPTEIASSILAIKERYNMPITVLFKPHTYSRTAALWEDFVSALSLADRVILTDIYPAREEPIPEITSERLALAIGDKAEYLTEDKAVEALNVNGGAVVLMGAGNLNKIVKNLVLIK
jgi:UDP-N-acetylmuramate--alanine ligase